MELYFLSLNNNQPVERFIVETKEERNQKIKDYDDICRYINLFYISYCLQGPLGNISSALHKKATFSFTYRNSIRYWKSIQRTR